LFRKWRASGVAGKTRGDPLFAIQLGGKCKGTSYRSLAFLGLGCARGQKTIIVADLRRSNARPK